MAEYKSLLKVDRGLGVLQMGYPSQLVVQELSAVTPTAVSEDRGGINPTAVFSTFHRCHMTSPAASILNNLNIY